VTNDGPYTLLYMYANFTALSSIGPAFWPIEVLHCGHSEISGFFCAKNSGSIKIFRSNWKINADDAKTYFLIRYRLACSSLFYYSSYARSKCFTPNRWAWSLLVTGQRSRPHHSIRHVRKSPAIRILHGSVFYRKNRSYCRLNFYITGIGNFAHFLRKIVEILKTVFTPQKGRRRRGDMSLSMKIGQTLRSVQVRKKKLSCRKETMRLLCRTVVAKYNGKTIFCGQYISIFNDSDVVGLQNYRIR